MESKFDKELLVARLKMFRKAKGLTQAALAEMIDVSPVNYAKYECGARTPSLPTLVRLSLALEVPLDCLLYKERDKMHLNDEQFKHLRTLSTEQLKAILDQVQNLYLTQK